MKNYLPWTIWLIAALFYALEFFQRVAPGVIAKPLMETFQIGPGRLGTLISFYFYAYALAQIPVGLLLDRYGAKITLTLAALVVSIGTYLFASSAHIATLALARILVGIGSAFAFIGCLKLAHDWFSQKRFAVIVGLTNTLGVMGALAGQAPLAALIQSYGWQQTLIGSAWMGLFITALIFFIVKPNPNAPHLKNSDKLTSWNTLLLVVKSKQAWLIALYAGFMVAPIISFAELWAISYLEINYHLSAVKAASVNTFIFIGIAVGGPINSFFSSYYHSRKRILCFGNVMALLLFLLLIFSNTLPILLLDGLLFAFGFFTSSMLVTFALNTELHNRHISATILGFTNMVIMIIGALFQPFIGHLLQWIVGSSQMAQVSPLTFKLALLILPLALLLNLFILKFIRESYQRSPLSRG